MKKEEIIRQYGEAAYERKLERDRARYKAHPEEAKARDKKYREEHPEMVKVRKKKYREAHKEENNARDKKYREEHPEKVKASNNEQNRKGSRRYDKKLEYNKKGIPGDKHKIRTKHANQYKPYKDIIAPDSQLHHEWIPKTSDYRGVALVEKEAHMHGFVDVIEILDGKITLLTEEEIRKGKKNEKEDI
jgi:hypothetical protein